MCSSDLAGWIVGARDGSAEVVVVTGDTGGVRPGVRVDGGSATYVMASGQPLALSPRPTAVLVDNNLGGVGLIRGLLDAGLTVGRDMSVVVHGDIPQDTLLTGLDVTTVTQPTPQTTGMALAEMVMKVLRSPDEGPYQMLRLPALQLGSSTGPLA